MNNSVNNSAEVFESLWKMICHFQGFESGRKMSNSTKVFESLLILTSAVSMPLISCQTLRISN